jgi:hypothetical protein
MSAALRREKKKAEEHQAASTINSATAPRRISADTAAHWRKGAS